MPLSSLKSVGDTFKTREKFAQLDQEAFLRLKSLGYQPQIIFDIGASDGSWSKDIVEVLPDATFHLFEPLIPFSDPYRVVLEQHLARYPNFIFHGWALGEKEGEASMTVFPNFVASSMIETTGAVEGGQVVTVPVKTLTGLVSSNQLPIPDVIKIDTQGYELAILKGSREILPQVGVLILECWLYRGYGAQTPLLTEIADWLLLFGFRLWDIGETYRNDNGVLGTLDCLFVNTQIGLAPSWFY
ncbi:MAG: FkbM family methyltransferase [Cyanobacteriota bacterium]|jgi:FkbM family methyltransferase